MTSGLGGSSDSHVEAQPQCLAWPVTGLPSTSKTEAKSLHPAAQLSGGLLRPSSYTLSPPAVEIPAQPSDQAHSPQQDQSLLGIHMQKDRGHFPH